MPRDNQKSRMYAAEQTLRSRVDRANKNDSPVEAFGSLLTLPRELKFGSHDAVQLYLDYVVMDSDWFKETYPKAAKYRVSVVQRRGNKFAHYQFNSIALHDSQERGKSWSMREIVVLHELAHHVVCHEFGYGVQGHGKEFVGVLAHLLDRAMAPEVGLLFRSCCVDDGVVISESKPARIKEDSLV